MKTKNKELYEAPSMMAFEVKVEGVVCTSGVGANRSGYGAANTATWGDEE